eukprot:scaffold49720_cov51-Cyclotella_meneghiniana.AAC.2
MLLALTIGRGGGKCVYKVTIKFGGDRAMGRRSSNERGGEDVICNISSGLLISILHGKSMCESM